ncbi:hypothetical protein CC86DRAFT_365694 [Ophiobolus disseminans]|uniref:Uncharacterized protein n=1 Tax=Ophiobolus disseminans TaxID=1469910 RepID=A0A6A7AKZ2_9PLEO|nr:hypothetical protein CC86DRAFT_365694 [Ophiobolus disseminans]
MLTGAWGNGTSLAGAKTGRLHYAAQARYLRALYIKSYLPNIESLQTFARHEDGTRQGGPVQFIDVLEEKTFTVPLAYLSRGHDSEQGDFARKLILAGGWFQPLGYTRLFLRGETHEAIRVLDAPWLTSAFGAGYPAGYELNARLKWHKGDYGIENQMDIARAIQAAAMSSELRPGLGDECLQLLDERLASVDLQCQVREGFDARF